MKKTFLAIAAAVMMLPVFMSCSEKKGHNDPQTPTTKKEVVKIEVVGEAMYSFKLNGQDANIVKSAELTNDSGLVHSFAANETKYSIKVEYPVAESISDKYKLTITLDTTKVDSTKSYDEYIALKDFAIVYYYKDGDKAEIPVAPWIVNRPVEGSVYFRKTKRTASLDFSNSIVIN